MRNGKRQEFPPRKLGSQTTLKLVYACNNYKLVLSCVQLVLKCIYCSLKKSYLRCFVSRVKVTCFKKPIAFCISELIVKIRSTIVASKQVFLWGTGIKGTLSQKRLKIFISCHIVTNYILLCQIV